MKTSRPIASRHREPVALSEDYGADSRARTSPPRQQQCVAPSRATAGATDSRAPNSRSSGPRPGRYESTGLGDRPAARVDGSANVRPSACAVDPKKRRPRPAGRTRVRSAPVSRPDTVVCNHARETHSRDDQQKRHLAGPVGSGAWAERRRVRAPYGRELEHRRCRNEARLSGKGGAVRSGREPLRLWARGSLV